jgi:Tol biopolymer transport system component
MTVRFGPGQPDYPRRPFLGAIGCPHRLRAWCLGLALLLIASACNATPSGQAEVPPTRAAASSAPSDLPGKLVFTRGTALWSMDLASGGAREIVAAPELGQITGARGAPDGKRVAFALYEVRDRRIPVSEIYLVDPDGSNKEKVLEATQPAEFYQLPAWDPDGKRLYVLYTATSGSARIRQIFRLDLASKEREVILDEAAVFDVSPDGKWMAIIRTNLGEQSIVLVDLGTKQERILVTEGKFAQITAPRFDPTSQSLAFSGTSASLGATPATDPPSGLLAWLAPATALAHGLPQDVWTIAITGGEPTKRLPMEADEPLPAWSPDGSQFAVMSFERIVTVPTSGGAPTERLAPGSYGAIDWLR